MESKHLKIRSCELIQAKGAGNLSMDRRSRADVASWQQVVQSVAPLVDDIRLTQ